MTAPAAQLLEPQSLKCPVCNAGFRGNETCPRCGSNLRHIMLLAARAWALRELSRSMLRAGDLTSALEKTAIAAQIHQPQLR
jgi:predicted amidophosphoribosyltransferase